MTMQISEVNLQWIIDFDVESNICMLIGSLNYQLLVAVGYRSGVQSASPLVGILNLLQFNPWGTTQAGIDRAGELGRQL
jgi:hypothetical protein